MADSITEGELASWMKKVGDYVAQDEQVASIETDKVDVQVNSPEKGTITKLHFKEGDSVQVGQDFFDIDTDGKDTSGGSSSGKSGGSSAGSASASGYGGSAKGEAVPPPPQKSTQTSPKPTQKTTQEKLAQEKPAQKAQELPKVATPEPSQKLSKPAPKAKDGMVPGTYPLPEDHRQERHTKMNRMRQRIAERLKESQNTAASLTTFNEVDMSSLVDFRAKYKDEILKSKNIKLGYMSAFVKACVVALQEIPAVNGSIVQNGDEDPTIVFHDYCDVSVAVATPKGLVTPVIRNCEKLSFTDIEAAISEYGSKAKDNKISIEDMAGGTFTISNGGVFGSLYGTPIINSPQSAILGMHAIKDRAVVVNGKVEVRPMMYIALTYDHRMIDGREAVTFLKTVKECIEDPRKMLLHL